MTDAINDLLNAKIITPAEHEIYMLFQANELGRKLLDRMTMEAFMDEPAQKEFSGEWFAFYDGRRSVLRDLRRAILKVNFDLGKLNNVG